MYLFYVDESGDTGMSGSPTNYFVLSAFVVHELRWQATLDAIITFRQALRTKYGLKMREEIHAAEVLSKPGALARIAKHRRLAMLRDVLDFEASLSDVNVVNVVISKAGKSANFSPFEFAWQTLIQRLHNTISHRNFPGPQNPQDYGLLIADRTDERRLRALLRRMRKFNYVPSSINPGTSRPIPITTLVEDPVHRDSAHSYFLQMCDVNAYFLYQKLAPNKFVRKRGAVRYFDRLNPVLCTKASRTDPQGVVRI